MPLPDFSRNPYFTAGYYTPHPQLDPTKIPRGAPLPMQSAAAQQQRQSARDQDKREIPGGLTPAVEPPTTMPGGQQGWDAGSQWQGQGRQGPRMFTRTPAAQRAPDFSGFRNLIGSITQRPNPSTRSETFATRTRTERGARMNANGTPEV